LRVAIRKGVAGATWVAVCNGWRAQVYEWVRPGGPLLQLQVMVHSESRSRNLDITTDKPGRTQHRTRDGKRGSMAPPTYPKEVERQIFAREVAGFLASRAHRGEFADLVLVAPPRFLGLLRELLSGLPPATVLRTVDKDLTAVKPHELMKALEEIVPSSPS
jgi:protein required for attachment to host cells